MPPKSRWESVHRPAARSGDTAARSRFDGDARRATNLAKRTLPLHPGRAYSVAFQLCRGRRDARNRGVAVAGGAGFGSGGGPVAERCGGSGHVSRFQGRPRLRGVPSRRGSRKPRPRGGAGSREPAMPGLPRRQRTGGKGKSAEARRSEHQSPRIAPRRGGLHGLPRGARQRHRIVLPPMSRVLDADAQARGQRRSEGPTHGTTIVSCHEFDRMATPLPAFPAARTRPFDVVVIGAGGAGLSAAITAADAGARVVVLEKMPIIGGNTQLAAGGMNAAGTPAAGGEGHPRRMALDVRGHDEGRPRPQSDRARRDHDEGLGRRGRLADRPRRQPAPRSCAAAARAWTARCQPVGGPTSVPTSRASSSTTRLKRRFPIRTHSRVVDILQRPDGVVRGVVVQDRRGDALQHRGARRRHRVGRLRQQPRADRASYSPDLRVLHQHRSAGHDRRRARFRRSAPARKCSTSTRSRSTRPRRSARRR